MLKEDFKNKIMNHKDQSHLSKHNEGNQNKEFKVGPYLLGKTIGIGSTGTYIHEII